MENASPLLSQPSIDVDTDTRDLPPEEHENTLPLTCHEIILVLGCLFFIFILAIGLILGILGLQQPLDGGIPVVKISYVDVSLHNKSTYPSHIMTSEWNIGFTVENNKSGVKFVYSDFEVSIDQARTWRSTIGIIPDFQQDSSQPVVHFNTTVLAFVPRLNTTEHHELPFRVTFTSDVKVISKMFFISSTDMLFRGRCYGMKIGLNGTYGSMSRPITCPHDPRRIR